MNVNVKMMIFFFSQTWVPSDRHYHWLKGPVNLLSMEHWAKYFVHTIHRFINFCYYEYLLGYGIIGVLLLLYFEVFTNRMNIY
jgi:hypothetical protein